MLDTWILHSLPFLNDRPLFHCMIFWFDEDTLSYVSTDCIFASAR